MGLKVSVKPGGQGWIPGFVDPGDLGISVGTGSKTKERKQSLGRFVSTAYGPPWNAMQGTGVTAGGTDLRGSKGQNKFIVAVDPAVIPLGTKLKISPNPFGNPEIVFLADDTGGAIKGNRIDFFDWRGRGQQQSWGRRSVEAFKTTQVDAGGGWISGVPDPGDAIDAAGDVAGAFADVAKVLLDPPSLGRLLADATVFFLKLIGRAVWDYLIAPPWHWTQRAVIYYWDEIMSSSRGQQRGFFYDNGAIITLGFWSVGYAVLWAKADDTGFGVTAPARDTLLGRSVRQAEGRAARRKLHAPKDVEKATPKKPETTASTIDVNHVRSIAVKRRRAVTVSGEGINGNGNGNGNGGTPGIDYPASSAEIAKSLGVPDPTA